MTRPSGMALGTYKPGSLPTKIQQFIETNSETDAYKQRSHSHQSLLHAYMVATFLEEAAQAASVSPLKRNAGLRDLAQRLHLWPTDVTIELQRDALKAIELLESYIKESLGAELRYVEKFEGKNSADGRFEELWRMRDVAVMDMTLLKEELRRIISLEENSQDAFFELNDLAPFIPGFTGSRKTAPRLVVSLPESEDEDIVVVSRLGVEEGVDPKKDETSLAVEKFKDEFGSACEEIQKAIFDRDRDGFDKVQREMRKIVQGFDVLKPLAHVPQLDDQLY